MPNESKCKRCGETIHLTPRSTNKRFCTKHCQEQWWNESRCQNLTQSEWQERRYGPIDNRELTETERYWIAAIIDGEGTIGIYRTKRQRNKSGYRYVATLSMCNTNKALVERVSGILDSWVYLKVQKGTSTWKDLYQLTVKGRALRCLLPQIAPYLIAKQEQAHVVLAFLQCMGESSLRTSSDHPMFERFYQETRKLNRKGRHELALPSSL